MPLRFESSPISRPIWSISAPINFFGAESSFCMRFGRTPAPGIGLHLAQMGLAFANRFANNSICRIFSGSAYGDSVQLINFSGQCYIQNSIALQINFTAILLITDRFILHFVLPRLQLNGIIALDVCRGSGGGVFNVNTCKGHRLPVWPANFTF